MGRKTSIAKTRNDRMARQSLDAVVVELEPERSAIRRSAGTPNGAYRKGIRPKNVRQANFIEAIDKGMIVFGIGPAGTGKTFIAVRKALEMLATNRIEKIVLSRPAMEAEGERIGFLPGNMEEKLHPYMLPLYDILKEAVGQQALNAMMSSGKIEICPLAFMRGRTFTSACIVLDEMQNATVGQIKMALTRMGEGTRAIVTGDPNQSDLEAKISGLVPCANALRSAPEVEIVRFGREDVVRSAIVSTVLECLGE